MGGKAKRQARIAERAEANKRAAIAFSNAQAQKTRPAHKLAGRLPVGALIAFGTVIAICGGAYWAVSQGAQPAHPPMKIWSSK